ncbi:MAG TPA: dihydrofolate reductase [Casimicrobiaceae bacterium]|nr:dihydrofolate reductase [Casimicrobiaceae bacterium]
MHDTPPPAGSPSAPDSDHAQRIAVIAAIARNGVIGVDNRLPWRLAEDLRRFRALTTGHAVIMGRHTWESLGRPLPGRQNIVVTRRRPPPRPDVEFAPSLDAALGRVRLPAPVFVIGGAALYRDALPRADVLYLTEIERDFAGDTRFPDFDRSRWRESARESRTEMDGAGAFAYHFAVYERVAPPLPHSIEGAGDE